MRLAIVRFLRHGTARIGHVANKENSIMVQHISWLSSPTHVKEHFSKYGKIVKVYLPFDDKQGIYRGHGYVEFEKKVSVQEALNDYNPPKLDGKILRISQSLSKK
jgi:RNA recognition motif-containing protein